MPATTDTAMGRPYGPAVAAKAAVFSPPSAIRIVVRAVAVVCRARAAYRVRPKGLSGASDAEGPGGLAGGVSAFQQERDEGDDDGVHREAREGEGGGEQ